MSGESLQEFLETYTGDRKVVEIEAERSPEGNSPFVIVRHGEFAAVISLMPQEGHLCIDVHAFADGKKATAGVFGMSNGRRSRLKKTGTTSHGWESADLIAVLIGKQGHVPLPEPGSEVGVCDTGTHSRKPHHFVQGEGEHPDVDGCLGWMAVTPTGEI